MVLRPLRRPSALVPALVLVLFGSAVPARAHHTNPREPAGIVSLGLDHPALVAGAGTWDFIANFTANPGTDLKTFRAGGEIYGVGGTLGGQPVQHVGQRIIRLTLDGAVAPRWVADHGSAACQNSNPAGATGQQHDVAVDRPVEPRVLVDAVDTTGRCHDPEGGGLEIVDISGIERYGWEPRELHLTRHVGTSHTVTVDATRPWLVYSNSATFDGNAWIDVLDIRTCLGPESLALDAKRDRCRPKVYRMSFEPEWSQQRDSDTGELIEGTESSCHDITAVPGKLYCAALNATLILDVRNLTDRRGNVRGRPLACEVIDGTDTAAKVTDCSEATEPEEGEPALPAATGWSLIGTFNHPGRACAPPPDHNTSCNSNLFVPSVEGISVSHEADPILGGDYMLVTDERGGGVVPPGSTCLPSVDNPIGNGGAHVFDLRDPANPTYALTPAGDKAVFVGAPLVPAPTFCDIHVIEPIRGESRFLAAYYSQGTKIVDFFVDARGRWTFDEVAAIALPGANTWAVTNFLVRANGDGSSTYYFMANDIERGIDIFSWTGPANPLSDPRAIAPRPAPRPAPLPAQSSLGSESRPEIAPASTSRAWTSTAAETNSWTCVYAIRYGPSDSPFTNTGMSSASRSARRA